MLTSSVSKQKERAELNQLVTKFLAKGGEVQIIPMGVKGECKPLETPKLNPKKQLPRGVRCRICDWCATNDQSLCNPEVTEYGGNQLVIDDLTGDMLCRICLSQSAQMNRQFKIEADPNYGQSRYLLSDEAKEFLSSTTWLEERIGRKSIAFDGHLIPGAYHKTGAHSEG